MSSEELFFWGAILLLGYTCVGYPALMAAWAAVRPRPPRSRDIEPAVTVLVVAYNEAPNIPGRLENLLALDYPRDRLEILLGSDGSTDGTPERARAYERAGVRVVAFPRRRGKPAVLNNLVPQAGGEIVVLADARQRFDVGVLRALIRPFADPHVGAVSGELVLTENADGTAVGEGVGFYWRYETLIRRSESRVDSTVSVTGPIYAIRRALFERIPEDTILDDNSIPMRIARRGYRVIVEPGARAYVRAAASAGEELKRKFRTLAGTFQLFAREPWLLNPLRNRLWFQSVSHKGLRLLSPLLLLTAFGSNLLLVDSPFYRWMLAGQIAFYAAALGGYALRNARWKIPLLVIPYVTCLLCWATLVGFLRFVRGRQPVTWEKASV